MPLSVPVYTVLGQQVFGDELLDSQIDFSSLKKGAYILKVIAGGDVHVKRFIRY